MNYCSGWFELGGFGFSGLGLGLGIKGSEGSGGLSSSAIRREKREAQRCPLVNLSSQLKQRPCSRRRAISAGVRRLRGKGGGLGGVGSRGRGGGVCLERKSVEGKEKNEFR